MGKKYTQFTADASPTDDDILLGVDVTSGQTKRFTRQALLSANPIVNPTVNNTTDGHLFTGKNNGWTKSLLTFALQSSAGQKEHVLRVTGSDVTTQIYPRMKIAVTRGVTAPTQCTDLDAITYQQYWSDSSVSGISFTDDFTVEAWIKLESYGAQGAIVSRFNGTNGWGLYLLDTGVICLFGNNGGGNYSQVVSYASVPLNEWVHIAGVLDMSAFSTGSSLIFMNGAQLRARVERAGTNPTALVQAGSLQVGAQNSTITFNGKICDTRVWSTKRTATQIRDNMNKQLVGNETNLVAYHKFNGNGNDSTSNANNLTATGTGSTPTASTLDNPMNNTEYGIVTKVAYSGGNTDITVFTGKNYNIPNIALSNLYFSSGEAPAGFPARTNFVVESLYLEPYTVSLSGTSSPNFGGEELVIPTGVWKYGYEGSPIGQCTSSSVMDYRYWMNDSILTNPRMTSQQLIGPTTTFVGGAVSQTGDLTRTSMGYYVFVGMAASGGGTLSYLTTVDGGCLRLWAELA